ncbi:protein trichome birefringence-like 43 [Pyrus ussuriensis x Pyrus communis]|uniref:Protein trichome birefringence-like 43 n=1 Tax=Pyrus ussuriensis x Pyrus communis TaxID=2448454 RepID=A0A5N5GDQ5_9ROSA|nr:protein trichome birefringence-like 43 [Pyrus ussuriensis x Pyrus communis]
MASFTIGAAVSLLVFSLLHHQVHGGLVGSVINGCDLSHGNWVFDDSYPLYAAPSCPFIETVFDCVGNGRPDKNYFQRTNCRELVEFEPMTVACMLYTAVLGTKYTLVTKGGLSTFTFLVSFSRNAFIVDIVGTPDARVLKLDSISTENEQLWLQNDVLIFDSWHWWLHVGRKQPWDLIQVGNRTYKDMDRLVAFEKALTTWAGWVDSKVDPNKTKVFFQGVSPDHSNATEWGDPQAINCNAQTEPLPGPDFPGKPHPAEQVLEKVLITASKPVHLLNITALSQLRKDAHPSVYGLGGHKGMDCNHWCLAGVLDTWNVLLHVALIPN